MAMRVDSSLPKGNIKSLRNIFSYLAPYRFKRLGVFIALVISSGSVLSMGKGISYLVDRGFSTNDPAMLNHALLFLFAIVIFLAASTYARFYLTTEIGEKVVADIRRDIFRKLINTAPSFFETQRIGSIMSRLTTDTTVLQLVIGGSLSVAVRNILMFTGGIILLVTTSPKLTGYILIMIPLIVIPILFLGRKVRKLSRITQEKVADISAGAEEVLYGIKIVQSYNREEGEYNNFVDKTNAAVIASMNKVKLRAALTAIAITLSFGAVGIVLWAGGHDVISGNMTAGQLSSFVFYSLVVSGAFGAISEVIGDLQRAAGSAEGLLELLGSDSAIKDPLNPTEIQNRDNLIISFKNVSFSYPSRPDIYALSSISFEVKEGETVALVGPSGAGKSTLLQLLLRFYDPPSGEITVNSVNIKELRLRNLRGLFAYVSQDPFIFSQSVRENIEYGREKADFTEVRNAAKAANAIGFIEKLPQGFDSYLGEKGVRLSGGERQRIAIARAILKNPKILLLDEATSSLDAENEHLVQEAIDKLMKNRTTIVIAHRLATVRKADKIIVIEDGKIESIGKHEELLKTSQLYKRLAELQFLV